MSGRTFSLGRQTRFDSKYIYIRKEIVFRQLFCVNLSLTQTHLLCQSKTQNLTNNNLKGSQVSLDIILRSPIMELLKNLFLVHYFSDSFTYQKICNKYCPVDTSWYSTRIYSWYSIVSIILYPAALTYYPVLGTLMGYNVPH